MAINPSPRAEEKKDGMEEGRRVHQGRERRRTRKLSKKEGWENKSETGTEEGSRGMLGI